MKRGSAIGLVAAVAVLAIAGGGLAWWLMAGSAPVPAESAAPAASNSPSTSVSAAPTSAVQERLDAYADACARPSTVVPDHCGIVLPWAADLGSLSGVAFRIEQYPVVSVSADGTSFDATGGVLVATATGTTREGTPGTFTYRTDDWSLRGDIRLKGEQTVVSVR